MNPIALRLLNQQLVSPQFSDPTDVVRHMGAVQAQEYRMMRWGVAMRTRRPSSQAFKRAFDRGQIIRLHLLRGTWQLVAVEDYWPLLQLCASKASAVIHGWMRSNRVSIGDDEVASIRDILVHTAHVKGSAVKEDFVQALVARGISMDEQRLSYHLRLAELSGTLCSGDLLPMKATYSLTSEKVGPQEPLDRDGALLTLTRKYFQSRQPATLEDYVWWSGLNIGDCRRGIALMGDAIHKVNWKGREYYVTAGCRSRGFRKGRYLLIPPYDEYLISYKSRDIVLSPDYRHKAHNNSGIFQPVIAHDGVICGNWAPFKDDDQAEFFMGTHDTDLQEEWARYRTFQSK